MRSHLALLGLGGLVLACTTSSARPASGDHAPVTSAPATSSPAPTVSASAAPASVAAVPTWDHGYAWATDAAAKGTLAARIPTERGFERVAIDPDSFAAFLRTLPLEAAGTPVRSFRGDTILAADDPRLAAVVAIDVGSQDLQQCADSVIRMHAEWRWSIGKRDVSYRSLSGFTMSFDRWQRGDRFVLAGKDLAWTTGARPDASHAAYRSFLDGVFTWANTTALARDAQKVARSDLRAGDFFVLGGSPGHAILVLDVAKDASGHTRALFGQGYMPAQSFHVVKVAGSPWVSLDDDAVTTPFWAPFPWDSLRRLP
jgi:hypothetical protein